MEHPQAPWKQVYEQAVLELDPTCLNEAKSCIISHLERVPEPEDTDKALYSLHMLERMKYLTSESIAA